MKVRSFEWPRVFVATAAQMRTILRGCWFVLRAHISHSLLLFASAMVVGLLLWPHDRQFLNAMHLFQGESKKVAHNIAWYLSTYGDYPTYNLPLALLIWIYGTLTKSSAWRRIAVIAFLGASLAGLFDDFFRLTLGRARPDNLLPDKFYGPAYAFSGGFQSFPSGHAASTFGTAAALLISEFPLGVVTTVLALAVVWARMELNRHYPSDVLVGSVIGIYFGLLVGWGAKLRRSVPPLDSHAGSP